MERLSATGMVPESGIPAHWKRHALKGFILTAVIAVLVATLLVDETGWERLRYFPARIALMLLGLVSVAWLCNGLRTWILARALGHRLSVPQAVGITLSMEFAIAATPGGVGGLATRVGLQRQAGIPLHCTMTMIAADISADLLFFLLLAPFALTAMLGLRPVEELLSRVDWATGSLLAVSLLVLAAAGVWCLWRGHGRFLFACIPEKWRRSRRWSGRGKRIRCKIRQQWREMSRAVRFLLSQRRGHYLAAFVLAAVQWTCRYSVLPVVLWGLGSPVDPLALMLLQGMLFLTGLLIVAPGGGGSLEILTTLILQPLVGVSQAAVTVILWRVFTYYLYLAAGATAFIGMLWKGKRAAPAKAETNQVAPEREESTTVPAGEQSQLRRVSGAS